MAFSPLSGMQHTPVSHAVRSAWPYLEGVRATRGKGYPKLAGELHSLLDIPWDLHCCEQGICCSEMRCCRCLVLLGVGKCG